jgi:transposase
MVWGGIWYQGRTELHIVKGTIDTNKYIHILKQFLLPSMPSSSAFLFQQDNATPHKPIEVELMLRDYAIELLQDYPPNSPDFNPIERVWSWIYHYIKRKYPTNRVTLIAAIKEA